MSYFTCVESLYIDIYIYNYLHLHTGFNRFEFRVFPSGPVAIEG